MKKVGISILFLFALLLLAFSVFAAKINSTSYKQSVIVSTGGENVSSSSYKMSVAIGIINKVINSTSFINRLGFFHTLLLANDQPCTTASQCEGGFCCSNLCKSSACPSPGGGETGGGGGAAAGAGAGGGGGGPLPTPIEEPKVKDFSISPSSIKEHLALGTAKIKTITIRNTGNTASSFSLSVATIDDFVFLSDSSFSLEPSQEKTIEANIIGKKLGSYIGEIEVTGDGNKKSISVVIEVESEQVLFDAKIDIPSAYKEVEAGKELKAQITLLNVGPPRKVDVTTTYIIKDKLGNIIHQASETFAVEKQTSFVKSFKVPQNLKPDDYLAIIEVRYENSFAVSSELFKVVPKEEMTIQKTVKSNTALLFALVIFVGLMFLFIYLLIPKAKIFNKPKFKKGK
ncbi:hypothetical protein HYX00_01010 [Candidatus Woesearchaeota archaeon]|nr:hypothetical protein [Candidatus Woesearchaeota archaeon]